MKKVISFSLWGEKQIYWVGAKKNIELAKLIYPDWTCRFYIDRKCRKELVDTLFGENVEIYLVDNDILGVSFDGNYPHSHQGMFWRFLAGVDKDVDVFISRDADSRLSYREASAVNEWLSSDKKIHIMRDHPYHTTPILGGMWGAKKGILDTINFVDEIKDWITNGNRYVFGVDQDFLAKMIYPLVSKHSLEHSEFGIRFGGQVKEFPTERIDFEFVGDVFDENDERHSEYWKLIS